MLLDILLVLMFAVANIIVLWAGLRIIWWRGLVPAMERTRGRLSLRVLVCIR